MQAPSITQIAFWFECQPLRVVRRAFDAGASFRDLLDRMDPDDATHLIRLRDLAIDFVNMCAELDQGPPLGKRGLPTKAGLLPVV